MATVIDTPEGIKFVQMCAFRGAVKLEGIGLRHSSGKSMMARAKKLYGIKGNRAKVLEWLNNEIEKQLKEKESQNG